jgi:hypothetical protein
MAMCSRCIEHGFSELNIADVGDNTTKVAYVRITKAMRCFIVIFYVINKEQAMEDINLSHHGFPTKSILD